MSNQEIEQRIRYLIEHGGLWDDPLDDLRKQVRRAILLGAAGVIGTWIVIATLH